MIGIAGFVLERELGRGGMGSVYLARDASGRSVALKVITHPESEDIARRFEREAALRIAHPNVVEVIASGVDGTKPYIAFELLEGETLAERLARGKLAAKDAVEVGVQVARGLAAAHAHGVVHRDLKPSNIFCCTNGQVKVLDFGIAAFDDRATADTRLTITGQIIGTPAYVSPEQARGDKTIDPRSDVWSLGVVLYEALAGQRPFGGAGSMIATLLAIITEDPAPIAALVPAVPASLSKVIERALTKSRDDRWPSAEALGAALAAAQLTPSSTKAPEVSARAGEDRVIAILLARGVRDAQAIKTCVEAHHGMFVPIVGDRAVGAFGVEAWEGDEAQRAAFAALEARPFADRVAIASGRASVLGRHIGGAVVGEAERASEAITTGIAVASGATALLAKLPLAEIAPGVFEITGHHRSLISSTFAGAPVWRALLLGRGTEVAQLERAVDTAFEESRAIVAHVIGPPGIGKSRLAEEVVRRSRRLEKTHALLFARAEPRGKNVALRLLSQAIKSRSSWGSLHHESSARAEVSRLALEAFGEEKIKEATIFLGEVLDVRMPATPSLEAALGDSTLMADRLRLVVIDYLVALAERAPLILVLEDLQWADAASLEVLRSVLGFAEALPLAVVATSRPELGEAFEGSDVVRVEPRALSISEIGDLMRAILGDGAREPLVRAIAERSAGNPLFVEQLALALREEAKLASDPSRLPLPLTIEAAVQSRLDHLPPDEKDLVKRAAIFGRPFSVQELAMLGVRDAEARLRSLMQRGLVRRSSSRRGPQGIVYRLESPLLAEVAHRMLGEELSRDLHLRAAVAASEASASDAEEIAQHFEAGGDAAAAAHWYARAAHQAAEHGDNLAVVRRTDEALRLGVPAADRYRVYMERNEALKFLGRREEQATALAAAKTHARTDVERARASSEEAFLLASSGRAAEAVEAAARAVEAAKSARDVETRAIAEGRRGMALAWAGRIEEAKAALEEAGALADRSPVRVRALAAGWRGQLAATCGDLGGMLDGFRAAIALHTEAGDVRRAAGSAANLADAYNRVGAYRDAETALEKAIEGCRRVGHRGMEGYALVNLAYALSMQQRFDEALLRLDEGAAIARALGQPRLDLLAELYRARALLESGDLQSALRVGTAGALRARELDAKGLRAAMLTVIARATLKLGDTAGALALSSEAIALRDALGGIEEDEADVFLTHAEALIAANRRDDARAILLLGRKRLMEIAAGIRDDEHRGRFLRDVPAHRFMLDRTA